MNITHGIQKTTGSAETENEKKIKSYIKARGEAEMDKLLSIALWILIPIAILLAICGTSVVVCLCLNLFFGINVFRLT